MFKIAWNAIAYTDAHTDYMHACTHTHTHTHTHRGWLGLFRTAPVWYYAR